MPGSIQAEFTGDTMHKILHRQNDYILEPFLSERKAYK